MPILPGFSKGQSDNLPKIDALAMFNFLGTNPDFMGAEIRGIKTKRSGRESYGDSAVGYVQVKRDGQVCTVKARVTPEHRIRTKAYSVTLVCDEAEETVISVQCEDCAASLGGCKHAVALLSWLHRRSEEPAVTSVACYWKPSKLSCIGKSAEILKGKNMGKKEAVPLAPKNGSFLKAVLEKSQALGNEDTVLTRYSRNSSAEEKLSIYSLISEFFQLQPAFNAEQFVSYCISKISEDDCLEASKKTVQQAESSLWFELRYGRITASKAYEASRCCTSGGSLVESILGARPLKDNVAMMRGRNLEGKVRREVEKKMGIKINLAGFMTGPAIPFMGASPDGISSVYAIEIKCPLKEKTMCNYIKDGEITPKYKAQLQMQMYFFKKTKGLFCMAHHDFEETKEVSIVEINYDYNYCADLISKCSKFWKTEVFPYLQKDFV